MASSSSRAIDRDLASSLQGIALGLILVFIVGELKSLLPLAPLEPAWQLRAGEALRGTAPLPLLAVVLMLLARRFDSSAEALGSKLLLLRRLSMAACLGFLLLIPLQITAGLSQINQTTAMEADQLTTAQRVAVEIEQADSTAAMNRAIAPLPGLASAVQGQNAAPLDQVRSALLGQINPQITRLETRLADVRRQSLYSALGLSLWDGLLSLAYAISFAAVASSGEDQPSLLEIFLWKLEGCLRWLRAPGLSRRSKGPISEDWIRVMQDGEEQHTGNQNVQL